MIQTDSLDTIKAIQETS
ncbi:hypothetical protein Gorai_004203 [Gossypium raimondii]|uniref:Uncharacterized protein n=1 Tax=Gossypium raimondii TaxID=29730 RepID=A0A7J8QIC3_GOSRA|nr:hypothetical protein [Gossypium raimondii]